MFEHSVEAAKRNHYIKDGEIVVITAGVPLGVAGTTNLIKVHVVGHILVKGVPVNDKHVCAPLCVANSEEELKKCYNPGDIIVMKETSNNIMEQLKTASAIVCEKDGKNSHAAIVGLSRDIPVIIGAKKCDADTENRSNCYSKSKRWRCSFLKMSNLNFYEKRRKRGKTL